MYDMRWFFLLYVLIVGIFSSVIYMINKDKKRASLNTMYDDDMFEIGGVNAFIH